MDQTSENIYLFPGSNLQICFVNEHHQSNETEKAKVEQNEDILAKQQRLKVSSRFTKKRITMLIEGGS